MHDEEDSEHEPTYEELAADLIPLQTNGNVAGSPLLPYSSYRAVVARLQPESGGVVRRQHSPYRLVHRKPRKPEGSLIVDIACMVAHASERLARWRAGEMVRRAVRWRRAEIEQEENEE